MTIHPMTTGRLHDLHTPEQSKSVNTETYGRSPPCKKQRLSLSLKGQRQLSLAKTNKELQDSSTSATTPDMQNMRPNLLDPMSLHASYVGSSLGVNSSLFGRSSDLALENDGYEREKDKHQKIDSFQSDKQSPVPPVATLLNLGNTCFLNSVLYTLRFTPGFAHLLHHLAHDLTEKTVFSSAGGLDRKSGLQASGSPNSRIRLPASYSPVVSEDPAIHLDSSRKKAIVLTERLHELMQVLHNAEQRGDLAEPFQADAFLQALREVNPLFQGNQQQDAHELLVCSLDYLREACKFVHSISTANRENAAPNVDANASAANNKQGKQNPPKKKKGKRIFSDKEKDSAKGKTNIAEANSLSTPSEGQATGDAEKADSTATQPWDFISESFEGVTVLRTTCLECEFVTERKESFMDICLPIVNESNSGDEVNTSASALFASTLMEVDFLRDANKYWCEQCVRYNEARRSVHYEKLPRLLVLQLKRFSLSYGSTVHTSKVNDYMPTPMQLDCFCERCQASSDPPLHSYRLYAIIMHLGATMASGHYVAYTRVPQAMTEYETCPRNKAPASSSNSSHRTGTEKSNASSNPNSILRFFKTKSGNASNAEVSNSPGSSAGISVCKSLNCCSAYPRKLIEIQEKERDAVGRAVSGNHSAPAAADDLWLECDDEVIRILRVHELEELLSRKPRSPNVTPYLLFYVQESLTAHSFAK